MNKEQFKKKVFNFLYPLSLIIAFISAIYAIPNLIHSYFVNFSIETLQFICFFVALGLVTFFNSYLNNLKYQNQQLHIDEVYVIRRIYEFNYSNLQMISNIHLETYPNIVIVLKDDVRLYFKLSDLIYINTQKKLEELDLIIYNSQDEILKKVSKKTQDTSDTFFYNLCLEDEIKNIISNYIHTLKNK